MIFIGNNIAISGLDTEYEAILKNNIKGFENSKFYDISNDFFSQPEKYELAPFIFSSEIKFIAFTTFVVPEKSKYNITGFSSFNNETVYVSIYKQNQDFTKNIIYSTKINKNGDFNFNFDSNELYFQQETNIIVWTQSFDYYSLISFNALLNPIEIINDMNIAFLGINPPEEEAGSSNILVINGVAENIGNQLNGIFIYDESFLDEELLSIQRKITNGFNKLENNIGFSSNQEFDEFYSALISRTEKTIPFSGPNFSIEVAQRETEVTWAVSYFYLWSLLEEEQSSEDNPPTIAISLNEKGVLDISWKPCLAGETLITMADNSLKRLDEIKTGDIVLDLDGKTTKVIKLNRGSFNPYHTLYYFENDIIIDEISSHRFFNVEKGCWEHLKKWKFGEHAIDSKGNMIKLLRKERIYERKENFGLDTESGRYFANDLLSGPARCNKAILEEGTLEQAINMLGSIKNFQSLQLLNVEELL